MSYDRSTRVVRELHRVRLNMYVELGVGTKHAVKDLGQCHSRWSQEAC
jgi:hypothetical protein